MLHFRAMDIFILFWCGSARKLAEAAKSIKSSSWERGRRHKTPTHFCCWHADSDLKSAWIGGLAVRRYGSSPIWMLGKAEIMGQTSRSCEAFYRRKKKLCCAQTRKQRKLARRAVIERSVSWPELKETKETDGGEGQTCTLAVCVQEQGDKRTTKGMKRRY